jgi:hypothetical protein
VKRVISIAAAAMVFMLSATDARMLACSWSIHYFYQVTTLKGICLLGHR